MRSRDKHRETGKEREKDSKVGETKGGETLGRFIITQQTQARRMTPGSGDTSAEVSVHLGVKRKDVIISVLRPDSRLWGVVLQANEFL